jgi:oxalate decarboxylase/phosphoglucose isomerase-like protein (cupin superfamily)
LVVVLEDHGDSRGASFSVPLEYLEFLGALKDLHVAAILPGCVRGNHFHVERREVIVVHHEDAWSLHWDAGEHTPVSNRTFDGAGVVAMAVPQHSAHAIRNDGAAPLWIFAATDGRYSPEAPDAFRREVVPT